MNTRFVSKAAAFAHMLRTSILALMAIVLPMTISANAQPSFNTPDKAFSALIEASKASDEKLMLALLGHDATNIISSGDEVEDAKIRREFVAAYDAKHEIKMEGDNKAILVVGQQDFSFPIPLVRKDSAWRFDSLAGRLEILYRRIGRNELSAIQACLAYYDAQNEYAEKDHTGAGTGIYAQRIASNPGKKDGLYWPPSLGADSPLGELVASAAGDGYRLVERRAPFHGYYFRILTRQGAAADGGDLDFVVRGKMVGGFALVAYPAAYRISGVKTFVISHKGVVYEKDLGPQTARLAERMSSFNPDQSWSVVAPTPPTQDGK